MQVNIDGVDYVPAPRIREVSGTLGQVLRECRKAAGMTLDEASAAAGCSKSHLWALENDKGMPGLDVACCLARTYGIPVGLLGACTLRPNAGVKR